MKECEPGMEEKTDAPHVENEVWKSRVALPVGHQVGSSKLLSKSWYLHFSRLTDDTR